MVTDAQVAALRAALTGDGGTFDCLGGASGSDYGDEFAALTATAFVYAARKRFGQGWSRSDVIRFVGKLRATDDGTYSDLNAEVAELMLFSALRQQPMPAGHDELAKGYAQIAVLAALVDDLDAQALEKFLSEMRAQTDQWLAGRARP